jgi:dTDP-4-amino-4,6-dideoxygalactose transaminase
MIPFNRPTLVGQEFDYIRQALEAGHLSGNGGFTKRCHAILEAMTGSPKALLTHSCTAALEMSAMLSGVGPGDEVIMPSFTFVSTANAFVMCGRTPLIWTSG